MLYNDATQRFVMWMHIDTADYELASCGMATSSSPTGLLFLCLCKCLTVNGLLSSLAPCLSCR